MQPNFRPRNYHTRRVGGRVCVWGSKKWNFFEMFIVNLIVICISFWGRFSSSPLFRAAQAGVCVWYERYPLDMYTQYLTWDGVLMFCADILALVVGPQFQATSKQAEWPSSLNNFWQTSSHVLKVLPLVGFMLRADMMAWVPGLEMLTMV